MQRFIAAILIVSIALPNLVLAQEIPSPPAAEASAVPVLVEVPPQASEVAPTSASGASSVVVEAVQRADIASQAGDRRGVQLALREAQRAERDSPVLRVARIALGHRLLPGVALRLNAAELADVIAHDNAAGSTHVSGHVFGVLGAICGLVGVFSIFLTGLVSDGHVGDGTKLFAGGFGGAGVALALIGILIHVQGNSEDGEVQALLQITPTTNGASLTFSSRF